MTEFEIRGPVPPGSGPLTRLSAPEYMGTIVPALRQEFTVVAQRTITQDSGIQDALRGLGWSVDTVAGAVSFLGQQLAPRFDAMLQLLDAQLDVLISIDSSLKNTRTVQAIERIKQAADLLHDGLYDWALGYADEAIDHDRRNPGGFMVGAWALVGADRKAEAIDYFANAARVASLEQIITIAPNEYRHNPYPWTEVMRQLSLCQLETGFIEDSRQTLDRAISTVRDLIETYSVREWTWMLEPLREQLAVLRYEASIAAVVAGDDMTADMHIRSAVYLDERYAQLAVGEPFFEEHPQIIQSALAIATRNINPDQIAEAATGPVRKPTEPTSRPAKGRSKFIRNYDKYY